MIGLGREGGNEGEGARRDGRRSGGRDGRRLGGRQEGMVRDTSDGV